MQEITRQLEAVRRTARRLLLAQAVMRWLAVVLLAMLACGLVDFALRLPSWLRLLIGLTLGVAAGVWLVRRVIFALGFKPHLSTLALRAERLYPQLAGVLASGVEFAANPQAYADSPLGAMLARATVEELGRKLDGVDISRLINPRRTIRFFLRTAAVFLLFVGVIVLAPGPAQVAAWRWLAPLGQAQWPLRTAMVSLVPERVWPTDTPLRLRARIENGYRPGLRTWAIYRQLGPEGAGPYQSALMNDQSAPGTPGTSGPPGTAGISAAAAAPGGEWHRGDFERLIDLPALRSGGQTQMEFFFQAGDAQTLPQTITLVDRPAVQAVRLSVEPPAYARGLLSVSPLLLDEQAGPIGAAGALEGSRLTLRFEFNKPLAAGPTIRDWTAVLAGLAGEAGVEFAEVFPDSGQGGGPYAIEARFVLRRTVQTAIHVTDEHGLSNLSERTYRIEAIADQPPAVSMIQPAADEAVLATAVVPLEAVAQDDLAVESITLEAMKSARDAGGGGSAGAVTPLRRTAGRANRLNVGQDLALASLAAQPGEEILVSAVARDGFDLDGRRHEPVRSTPRRLRVIDQTTLVSQIRAELGGVRQQALRLETQQRDLLSASLEKAQSGQEEIARRLEAQAALLKGLLERIQRNRLEEPQLKQLIARAGELVDQAGQGSRQAGAKLLKAQQESARKEAHRAEAQKDQESVGKALTDLINLLDQGRDTLALQLQLQQLMAMQEALAGETRQALPRTLGKSPEQLSPQEKQALAQLAERQTALSGRAEAMTRQMRSTAEALSRDKSDSQAQAAAQALSEAAAIAERQGLQQNMRQAAEAAGQNRLSESSQAQQASAETMKKMLGQLGSQQTRQQEVLRRRLTALADAIEKLVEQQKAQLDRLKEAVELAGLDTSMTTLRRNTLAVGEEARQAQAMATAAKHLDDAAGHQGQATVALRASQREPATGSERMALASLEAALTEVRKLEDQAQAQQSRQQRQALKAEYEKLAGQQEAIAQATAALTIPEQLSRRQRADLIDLGNRQADLQIAAQKLREQVEKTLLFAHLHGQIDTLAGRVTTQLRSAQSDGGVLDDQNAIASMLHTMAQALEDAQKQEDFERQTGGGGGGGGAPPLIPPTAELKLLRGVQATIYQRTRSIAQRPAPAAPSGQERRKRDLLDLSTQQRDLSGLGERLIESMQQRKPAPPAMEPSR